MQHSNSMEYKDSGAMLDSRTTIIEYIIMRTFFAEVRCFSCKAEVAFYCLSGTAKLREAGL